MFEVTSIKVTSIIIDDSVEVVLRPTYNDNRPIYIEMVKVYFTKNIIITPKLTKILNLINDIVIEEDKLIEAKYEEIIRKYRELIEKYNVNEIKIRIDRVVKELAESTGYNYQYYSDPDNNKLIYMAKEINKNIDGEDIKIYISSNDVLLYDSDSDDYEYITLTETTRNIEYD